MGSIKDKGDKGKIRVADITLAQLSRGLYRSTACAFKELINNAFDADATEVRIDTNFPEFDFISCIDNGTGMALDEFKRYFAQEGVGSCLKRKGDKKVTDKFKRPIIGKLGIGMMSIGQLCHSFEIESHYIRGNKRGAYSAEIILEDVKIPTEEELLKRPKFSGKDVEVGRWKYRPIEFDEDKIGFRIYSTDIRYTFRREMKESLKSLGADVNKLTFNLRDLHKKFFDKRNSVRDCKPYLETIWELETLCPVAYQMEVGRFPININKFPEKSKKTVEYAKAMDFIRNRQNRLVGFKFTVVFDGIELRRHIQLPSAKDVYSKLYFVDFDEVVYTDRLKFSGYVFAQASKAIKPLELSGIQIRLKEVGIGGYDNTFLKFYEKIETIRSRWISGEIFVDEGLESALNIDRDSFNEHDEHYKKLQYKIHEKVHGVFIDIDRIAREKSNRRRTIKGGSLRSKLGRITDKYSGGQFAFKQSRLGKVDPPVSFDASNKEIILNTDARPVGKKKADSVLSLVMFAREIARRTSDSKKEEESKFYDILKELLGEFL